MSCDQCDQFHCLRSFTTFQIQPSNLRLNICSLFVAEEETHTHQAVLIFCISTTGHTHSPSVSHTHTHDEAVKDQVWTGSPVVRSPTRPAVCRSLYNVINNHSACETVGRRHREDNDHRQKQAEGGNKALLEEGNSCHCHGNHSSTLSICSSGRPLSSECVFHLVIGTCQHSPQLRGQRSLATRRT